MAGKNKTTLPPHPKHHHKPFRFRHLGLFFVGLMIGIFGTYRGGYVEKPSFDINRHSPAVVKIFHVICGTINYQGQTDSQETCSGSSGSGFLISSDGYIATSGHVVVHGAPDLLSNKLQENPRLLNQFAAEAKLRLKPEKGESRESAFLKTLYRLPETELKLENKREKIFVALGDKPLVIDENDSANIFDKPDDNYIKSAQMVANDYAPEDILNINSNSREGFSANDVALLKINVEQAPTIMLGDANKVNQNDEITLVGFPKDADNQLTTNDIISPSVTNGTISSIRTTTGQAARLFQSDADASEGSSGGPAINQNGEAIGIVTYRFKDKEATNAAKSYIRAIDDLKDLLASRSIVLRTESKTNQVWSDGLELAAHSKYAKAIENYRSVLKFYPPHRLANSYIDQAKVAISEGKDVKDPPYLVFITLGAIVLGGFAVALAAVLISRHRLHHHRYKKSYYQSQ